LHLRSLGHLQKLRIRHDNVGEEPGWFVENIIVQDLQTYLHYMFTCNTLLAKKEIDRTLEAELLEEGRFIIMIIIIITMILIALN